MFGVALHEYCGLVKPIAEAVILVPLPVQAALADRLYRELHGKMKPQGDDEGK